MKRTPPTIDWLRTMPGKYYITANTCNYIGIEVDSDGTIYQLTPKGERDGILDDDGWETDVVWVHPFEEGGEL